MINSTFKRNDSGVLRTAKPKPSKPTLALKPKTRKCKVCRTPFIIFNSMTNVKWCSPECGLALSQRIIAKGVSKQKGIERKDITVRRNAIKPMAKRLSETQTVINRYVRLRDHFLPCVSCDKPASWNGQWHASHYKSTGSNSALRFNLWNIHKSCSVCNNYLSGNIGEYIPELAFRVGKDRLIWLNNHPRSRTYTPEYLDRMKRIFSKKCSRLMKLIDGLVVGMVDELDYQQPINRIEYAGKKS
ncbi:recombination protein NinG [Glaciimonas immobilis]|uniref:Recombination protein NinG n=1 Tax=Glaciimonas immobilis TaxID=728004 RepID=A0A840RW61_9BURK|nr:recombination protein NinG [Glaciimonas immobilis]KAF3997517.1 recombination protein NinG [Glaciimonas immobilis]MBB5200801.1 hypothetical protein [Glaciimonas immobilis]